MSSISLAVYVIAIAGAGTFFYRLCANDMSGYTSGSKHTSEQYTALPAGAL
jgi:hypothetical protein